jgi:hypothetical protein
MNSLLVILLLGLPAAGATKDTTATKTDAAKAAATTTPVRADAAPGNSGPKADAPKAAGEKAVAPGAAPAAAAAAKGTGTPPTPSRPALPPPKGSHIAPDNNMCFQCHTNEGQWDEKDPKSWRRYIPEKTLKEDVHWQKGVTCVDCHRGNYDTDKVNEAHAKEDGFRSTIAEITKYCAHCHKTESVELRKGVHAKAGPKDERGLGTPLECHECHGSVAHHLLPVRDKNSPVFLDNQVVTCDACHRERLEDYRDDLATYRESVHGHGLYSSGLQVVPACADCHGAHGIYRAADKRSTLHTEQVAATCGKCHRFIAERLAESVHANGGGPGHLAAREAPGGKEKRHPSCTSCHQGHDLADPESARFRLQLPNRCGNCHSELSQHYAMSMHGELTELGYGPGAKCSDCHGAHDILPASNPASRLSAVNRAETCMKCHANITANFLDFDPHADHTTPKRDPVLYWIYRVLVLLLVVTFSVFGVHSVLWLVRSLVDVLRHGRPRGLVPGGAAYVRFQSFHRWFHTILLISFLALAITGLPLKYSQYEWAKALAWLLGGFESTSVWHRLFGLVTFVCLAAYLVRMVSRYRSSRAAGARRTSAILGPDSPVPNFRDVKDFARMALWFVGLGKKPTFERWAY